jgi:hypothetical protein
MKKIRSARGTVVDFDLMKIKESIGSQPAPTDVAARQHHIDARLRRRMRNMKKTPLSTAVKPSPAKPTSVEPRSPDVNQADVEFIDPVEDVEEPNKTAPKTTQQKARRKT